MLKKKYMWAFQGFDTNGDICFPETFVKLDARPSFPYMDAKGGKLVPISGEIRIRQFFTMYENVGAARNEFDKFNGKDKDVQSACLILYDGAGSPLEKWILNKAQMHLCIESELEDDDHIIAEWQVNYEESEYIQGMVLGAN